MLASIVSKKGVVGIIRLIAEEDGYGPAFEYVETHPCVEIIVVIRTCFVIGRGDGQIARGCLAIAQAEIEPIEQALTQAYAEGFVFAGQIGKQRSTN